MRKGAFSSGVFDRCDFLERGLKAGRKAHFTFSGFFPAGRLGGKLDRSSLTKNTTAKLYESRLLLKFSQNIRTGKKLRLVPPRRKENKKKLVSGKGRFVVRLLRLGRFMHYAWAGTLGFGRFYVLLVSLTRNGGGYMRGRRRGCALGGGTGLHWVMVSLVGETLSLSDLFPSDEAWSSEILLRVCAGLCRRLSPREW